MKAIDIEGVSKRYRGFALADVNLSLEAGYLMGLFGLNGAGKTTLIKTLLGLFPSSTGKIHVLGKNIRTEGAAVRQRIGFVLGDTPIYPELRPREVERILAPLYPAWSGKRFREICERLAVPQEKKIGQMSQGGRMKFGVAAALSHGAELLLLDEPAAGLDPLARREVISLVRDEMEAHSCSVLISTHITTDLDAIADFITLIDGGRIVISSPRTELLDTLALCRGDSAILSEISPARFLRVDRNPYGFSAITGDRAGLSRDFGNRIFFDRITIEDLMNHFLREELQ